VKLVAWVLRARGSLALFLMVTFALQHTAYISSIIHHYCSLNVSLYGCLRLACGWILWHARQVDDGVFRRHVCEALFVCYVLQALAVIRAQFTDRHTLLNWIAILILLTLATAYGMFRFQKGGNMIKVYELPSSSNIV
jgi:hypothetical protein